MAGYHYGSGVTKVLALSIRWQPGAERGGLLASIKPLTIKTLLSSAKGSITITSPHRLVFTALSALANSFKTVNGEWWLHDVMIFVATDCVSRRPNARPCERLPVTVHRCFTNVERVLGTDCAIDIAPTAVSANRVSMNMGRQFPDCYEVRLNRNTPCDGWRILW